MPSTSPHRDALGPAFTATGGCWVCGALERRPYHEAIVDFSEYAGQDPELAAYTGVSVRLVKCAACGFGQPEHLPALPRFFERMYDQLWSPAWVQQEFEGTQSIPAAWSVHAAVPPFVWVSASGATTGTFWVPHLAEKPAMSR